MLSLFGRSSSIALRTTRARDWTVHECEAGIQDHTYHPNRSRVLLALHREPISNMSLLASLAAINVSTLVW